MFCEFALIGVTASGKSDLALNLAQEVDSLVLSLDSLCVYKQIDIASAKPSKKELAQIPHFGVNLIDVDDEFNVVDFINEYKKAREFAIEKEIPLIITGGSSFYLKAMMSGLSPRIKVPQTKMDSGEIYALCAKVDPQFAAKFSQNDKFRMNKWLGIYEDTGCIPSVWLRENTADATIKELKIYEITSQKSDLDKKIALRTQKMFEMGLLDEAKELFGRYDKDLKPLNSIGLKECGAYFDELKNGANEHEALNRCKELIITHTIQLAKRQRTFNKGQFKERICANLEEIRGIILNCLKNRA